MCVTSRITIQYNSATVVFKEFQQYLTTSQSLAQKSGGQQVYLLALSNEERSSAT
jgi:hypothetical protein